MAMGVSSVATGLTEESSCSADAGTTPEGFKGCGEPSFETGDSSTPCKGGMKDQHKEICRMARNVTVFESLANIECGDIRESPPLDAFTAVSILNSQARKRISSPISANLF